MYLLLVHAYKQMNEMFLKSNVQMTDSVKRILNRYLGFPFLVKNYYVHILSICIGIKAGTLMHLDVVLENIQSSSFTFQRLNAAHIGLNLHKSA